MSAWISTAIATPPLVDGESEFVLVAAPLRSAHPIVAKYRFTEDPGAGRDDPPGWSVWVMFGRDGYTIDGVTHWMMLPEMPR